MEQIIRELLDDYKQMHDQQRVLARKRMSPAYGVQVYAELLRLETAVKVLEYVLRMAGEGGE